MKNRRASEAEQREPREFGKNRKLRIRNASQIGAWALSQGKFESLGDGNTPFVEWVCHQKSVIFIENRIVKLINSYGRNVLEREVCKLEGIASEMNMQSVLLANCGYKDLAEGISLEVHNLALVIEQIHKAIHEHCVRPPETDVSDN
jgi:hypothetical protein